MPTYLNSDGCSRMEAWLLRTFPHWRVRDARSTAHRLAVEYQQGLDEADPPLADAVKAARKEIAFIASAARSHRDYGSFADDLAARLARAEARAAQRHPPLHDLQATVYDWGTATFPDATNGSIAAHLRSEVTELQAAISLQNMKEPWEPDYLAGVAEEAADCLLLLLHLAQRLGFDLQLAAQEKFAVNQERSWNTPDPAGFTRHDAP